MEGRIEIGGLAALQRSLKAVDAEAPKRLRLAQNEAANLLISRVRPQIPVRTGAARDSLRARSTRTSARIGVGGRKAPYYPWLDFGGQGRRPGRPPYRQFISGGRYVYPTLAKVRPEVEQALADAIGEVISSVGLEEG